MKTFTFLYLLFLIPLLMGCSTDSVDDEQDIEEPPTESPEAEPYFPPVGSNDWESTPLAELGWNREAEQEIYEYLEGTNTDAFIILKDGKIVIEQYFGEFTASTNHAWFSVGKSLTAFVMGMAQKDGSLDINDSSQDFLGEGWSSLSTEQERNVSIENHITMTTGLDYTVDDLNCSDADCLRFLNEPNAFWYYHTGAYTLTQDIIANATGEEFESYFDGNLKTAIGMDGNWFSFNNNNIYRSTARSMARFGVLVLNRGRWNDMDVLVDESYFEAMTGTSQELNNAYGYLWWLNGKDSYRLPGSTNEFEGSLIPNAPDDLIAGLGANDQKLYVVASENLVIVRMGGAAENNVLGPSGYDNELWEKLNDLMKN